VPASTKKLAPGSEAEQLAVFRRVRDEICRVFQAYAAGLREGVLAH
jgi:arsenate reductase